jgi:hypothetical protein
MALAADNQPSRALSRQGHFPCRLPLISPQTLIFVLFLVASINRTQFLRLNSPIFTLL